MKLDISEEEKWWLAGVVDARARLFTGSGKLGGVRIVGPTQVLERVRDLLGGGICFSGTASYWQTTSAPVIKTLADALEGKTKTSFVKVARALIEGGDIGQAEVHSESPELSTGNKELDNVGKDSRTKPRRKAPKRVNERV